MELNLEKLREELELLQLKMKRRELSRLDVQRILALEWHLNGTWDEIDNYDQYLAPGAKEFLYENQSQPRLKSLCDERSVEFDEARSKSL
jgi:hypothetical protein